MKKSLRVLAPLAAAAVPLAFAAGPALADSGASYQATLNPINHQSGSGMLMLTLSGDTATIDESWSGLATSFNGGAYPHVQHIHIGAKGVCPTMAADKNGDGVVSTTEGAASYGEDRHHAVHQGRHRRPMPARTSRSRRPAGAPTTTA